MYQIRSSNFIISHAIGTYFLIHDRNDSKRIRNVEFHIESDDYFGTLATILDLIKQNLTAKQRGENCKKLEELKNDLLFLQNRYTIKKK